MKEKIKIFVVAFLLTISPLTMLSIETADATPGRLKSGSIIDRNGTYYGTHGSDDHWHLASKNSDGSWSAVGPTLNAGIPSEKPSKSQGYWSKDRNTWYYKNSNGITQKGWQKVDSNWYYLGTNGAMHTGWTKVSNRWYYMNSSGAMQTKWTKVSNRWYYMNSSGAMETGWIKLGGNWYYLQANGSMQTGSAKINGTNYAFDTSGRMK